MKTVALIPGWAEGKWQTKKFVQHLKARGFQIINNPLEADILVAHSAGCYFVPDNAEPYLIILIGLPFWPGKSTGRSLLEKLRLEIRQHQKRRDIGWFISKLAHNTWYTVIRPGSLWHFFKNHKKLKLPQVSSKQKVILVRNKNDCFCTPKIMKLLGTSRGYRFAELPGLHDDCWLEPAAYIDLLLKEYN